MTFKSEYFCHGSSLKRETIFPAVILFVLLIAACSDKDSSPPPSNDYTALSNPEPVTINGYAGDAMEPFISRDGTYLFFNNNSGSPTDKDLFYATSIDGTTFDYKGPIAAINTAAVDGVPTMDAQNHFYYVSAVNYNPPATYDTLYTGLWTGSTVTGVTPLSGLTSELFTLNPSLLFFDIEVSPHGSTLYLSVGAFSSGSGFPSAADIHIAVDSGSGFALSTDSASIMANVNTTNKLEYAPAISSDGLELFFTRFDPTTNEARIYRSVRSNTGSAFGVPQLVSAITGFAEGPAFSPDEKALYYHRQNPGTGRFEIYRVTRP